MPQGTEKKCHGAGWVSRIVRAVPGFVLATILVAIAGCGAATATPSKTAQHVAYASKGRHATHHTRRSKRHHRRHASRTPAGERMYATGILPVLNRSVPVFNRAATAAATGSGDALGTTCGVYGSQISILASEVDGVPHPYSWYSRVGRLHHRVLDVYHAMMGGAQACQTAASSGDSTAQPAADMSQAASAIQQLDNEVRGVAH